MRDAGAGNDLSSKGWLFSRVARGVVLHEGTAMTMPFQVQVVAPDSSKRDIVDIVESVMQVTHDVSCSQDSRACCALCFAILYELTDTGGSLPLPADRVAHSRDRSANATLR